MKILVTGAAGFIGFYTTKRLLERGDEVVGIDNINSYYDPALKFGRLAQNGIDSHEAEAFGQTVQSSRYPGFRFIRMALEDRDALHALFEREAFDAVVNLAAQAGVRYSIQNPYAYVESNVVGFLNILEGCRKRPVKHLVYASSSSIYGMNDKVPYSEEDQVDHPVSLYAATKKANELMAHAYAKLYRIPSTGLRFFTVYGPWGRPDMAPMLFSRAISRGETIKVFNNGDLARDFTYIEDIVEGVTQVIDRAPQEEIPYKLYNIGCSHPVKLMDFIRSLERALGCKAQMEMLPMQPGDVYQTYADTSRLERDFGYKPATPLDDGIDAFIRWYRSELNPLK